jgi:hypothetical protein
MLRPMNVRWSLLALVPVLAACAVPSSIGTHEVGGGPFRTVVVKDGRGDPRAGAAWIARDTINGTTWSSGSCPLRPVRVERKSAHRLVVQVRRTERQQACTADAARHIERRPTAEGRLTDWTAGSDHRRRAAPVAAHHAPDASRPEGHAPAFAQRVIVRVSVVARGRWVPALLRLGGSPAAPQLAQASDRPAARAGGAGGAAGAAVGVLACGPRPGSGLGSDGERRCGRCRRAAGRSSPERRCNLGGRRSVSSRKTIERQRGATWISTSFTRRRTRVCSG